MFFQRTQLRVVHWNQLGSQRPQQLVVHCSQEERITSKHAILPQTMGDDSAGVLERKCECWSIVFSLRLHSINPVKKDRIERRDGDPDANTAALGILG